MVPNRESRLAGRMQPARSRVVVTGVGIVCGVGNDAASVWASLCRQATPVVSMTAAEDVALLPIRNLDLPSHFPDQRDRRMLSPLMEYGVVAAKQALTQAGLLGGQTSRIDVFVACNNGERDNSEDLEVIASARTATDPFSAINELVKARLRPTAVLGELPNMLAANISVLLGVEGATRTFIGGTPAGVHAVRSAYRNLSSGWGDAILVGGAFNAENPDVLAKSILELKRTREGSHGLPAQRREFLGSACAFLVLEREEHAAQRQVQCLGYIDELLLKVSGVSYDAAEQPGALEEKGAHKTYVGRCSSWIECKQANGEVEWRTELTAKVGQCNEASLPLALAIATTCLKRSERLCVQHYDRDVGHITARLSGSVTGNG